MNNQDVAVHEQLVNAFPTLEVMVIGDVMLDEYIWGNASRLSPEAPVPVVELLKRNYTAGGAANVAVNAAYLCGCVRIGGVIGADYAASCLKETLSLMNIDTNGLMTESGRPTTLKTRVIAQRQQIVRVDIEHRNWIRAETEEILLRWVESELPRVQCCTLSDYAKGVVSASFASRLIQLARDCGCPVIVDPKGLDYSKYAGAMVITPNLHEAEQIVGRRIVREEDLFDAGRSLMKLLPGSDILITRGPEGMMLFRQGEEPIHIPSSARSVYDVTGAGDTVVSTLALAVAAGAPVEVAARLANTAAGIVVGKTGTASATREELLAELGIRSLVQSPTP